MHKREHYPINIRIKWLRDLQIQIGYVKPNIFLDGIELVFSVKWLKKRVAEKFKAIRSKRNEHLWKEKN